MARRFTRNVQRDWSTQMYTVCNYQSPPYGMGYELTKFDVVEWEGGAICVTREYRNPEWHAGFAYHECIQIGPRGAVKIIYRDLY